MPREDMSTLSASLRLLAVEAPISQDRSRAAAAMADLFGPLDGLLRCGGDLRLDIDPASGANEYGCRPFPRPGTLSFASSTATSISARAYARVAEARDCQGTAQENLQSELAHVGAIVSKIEWLLAHWTT